VRQIGSQFFEFRGGTVNFTTKMQDCGWALILSATHTMNQLEMRKLLLEVGGEDAEVDGEDKGQAGQNGGGVRLLLLLLVGAPQLELATFVRQVELVGGIEINLALRDNRG